MTDTKFMQDVYLSVSDLNYEGTTTSKIVSRQRYYRTVRWDGRYLIERISRAKYEQIQYEEFSREYDSRIMKKYNVGKNYKSNRWFMEQVRPTLM